MRRVNQAARIAFSGMNQVNVFFGAPSDSPLSEDFLTPAAQSVIAYAEKKIDRKIVSLCDEIKIFGSGLLFAAAPIGHASGGHANAGGKLPLGNFLLTQKFGKPFGKLIVHAAIV